MSNAYRCPWLRSGRRGCWFAASFSCQPLSGAFDLQPCGVDISWNGFQSWDKKETYACNVHNPV